VADAIREYILKGDVIAWIADSVLAYSKKRKSQSQIGILESQISENKKAIKNLLAAIEAGIITASTKERLLELEAEQSRLSARLSIEKEEVPEVAKEDVIAWLESFRDGDVNDKKYQAKLFNTFLIAVYLYDKKIKIAFNFSGKKNTIQVPLDATTVDNIDNDAPEGCSSDSLLVEQKRHYANTGAIIYMVNDTFVLECSIA
jgi:hypothetical protein